MCLILKVGFVDVGNGSEKFRVRLGMGVEDG